MAAVVSRHLPYFRWYPKDCDTDELVRSMTDAEFGFYVRCLNHSWVNGSLPSDLHLLARMMGKTKAQFNSLWKVVGQRFTPGEVPDRLVNPRQEIERMRAEGISEERARAAISRWKNNANAEHCKNAIPSELHIQTQKFAPLRAYGSRSNLKEESTLPLDFDAVGWAENLCKRWGKPGQKQLGRRYFLDALADGAKPQDVEDGFAAWEAYHETLGWNFCPQNIAEWVMDKMWTERPPEVDGSKNKSGRLNRLIDAC